MPGTVTVTKKGKRFISTFSALPGQRFGPWEMSEMIRDLTISALLEKADARNLVMDAAVLGSATTDVNC